MNDTLLKALVALVPAAVVFAGSVVLSWRVKTLFSFFQLIGAGSLVMVVLFHIFEALHLFPSMGWGLEHSVGEDPRRCELSSELQQRKDVNPEDAHEVPIPTCNFEHNAPGLDRAVQQGNDASV